MADDTSQQIKLSSILPHLSQEEQMAIARGTVEQVSHVLYEYAKSNGIDPDTAGHLVNEALDSYAVEPQELVAREKQEETQKNPPSALETLQGVASAASLGIQEAQEDNIAYNFNEKYKADVQKELDRIEGLKPEEKQAALEELLNKMKGSTIAKQRVDDLAERLGEKDGKTTKASENIRRRHLEQQEKKRKDTSDENFQKYNKRLASKLLDDTQFKDAAAREDYILKMAQHQLYRTHNEFTDLFYEKEQRRILGLKFRKRTISLREQNKLAKGQRKDLKPIFKWQEKRAKEKGQEAAQKVKKKSRLRRFFEYRLPIPTPEPEYTYDETWVRTEYPNEYNSGGGGGGGYYADSGGFNIPNPKGLYDKFKQAQNLAKMLRGIGPGGAGAGGAGAAGAGGAAAGAGGAAAGAAGGVPVGVVILIILAILLLILLIIFIIANPPDDLNIKAIPLECTEDVGSITDTHALGQRLYQTYHVNMTSYSQNPTDEKEYIGVMREIYGTVCVLFGHQYGSPYDQKTLNSFGRRVVGNWGSETGQKLSKQVDLQVIETPEIGPCGVEKDFRDNLLRWVFYNPQQCDPWRLRFLVGRALARSMLEQDYSFKDLTGSKRSNAEVFSQFAKDAFSTGVLPTYHCTSSPDNQAKDCFADMVGEYISYAYYLDKIPSDKVIVTPTAPTNTPTPFPTGKATPTPDQSPQYPNFADFPVGQYKPYFDFAFNNLFDNQTFFLSSGSAACPDTIASTGDQDTIVAALDKLGFTVAGDTMSKDMVAQTYETICMLYQSPKYKALMKSSDAKVHIIFSDKQNCCGYTDGDTIYIYGWKDTYFNRFTLVHELTHELVHANRSPQLRDFFDQKIYDPKNTLPTFNCQHDYDSQGKKGPYEDECLADALGLYVTYTWFDDIFSGPQAGKPMPDYPSGKYKDYYNFIFTQIFGGVVFNGATSSGGYATFAPALVDSFKANDKCFHDYNGRGWAYLNRADENCIYSLSPSLPKEVTDFIKKALAEINPFQCVAFVKSVAIGVGKPFDVYGDARQYYYHPPSGYKVISRVGHTTDLQAGDVVVYDYPGGQHIADVSKIISTYSSRDGKTYMMFEVAEGNGGYCKNKDGSRAGGCIDRANDTTGNSDIVGWLRPL